MKPLQRIPPSPNTSNSRSHLSTLTVLCRNYLAQTSGHSTPCHPRIVPLLSDLHILLQAIIDHLYSRIAIVVCRPQNKVLQVPFYLSCYLVLLLALHQAYLASGLDGQDYLPCVIWKDMERVAISMCDNKDEHRVLEAQWALT